MPVPVEVQAVEEYLGLSASQYRLSAESRERRRQLRIKQARERERAREMFKHGASAATVASKVGISKQTAAAYKRGLAKS